MAERRMFTKKITDNDNFMSLSSEAQALYLHLSMSADDDGFCNQVSLSMFKAHASGEDLQALIEKRYIYQFENGVVVIKHWRMSNSLRKDRYTPTAYQDELSKLCLKENGSYTWLPDGCQMVAERLPQFSLVKDSLVKDSLVKINLDADGMTNGNQEETKKPHGTYDNVYLSDSEYKAACNEFTKSIIDQVVNNISNHIKKNNGTGYGDRTYQTVIKWANDFIERENIDIIKEKSKIDKLAELERRAILGD